MSYILDSLLSILPALSCGIFPASLVRCCYYLCFADKKPDSREVQWVAQSTQLVHEGTWVKGSNSWTWNWGQAWTTLPLMSQSEEPMKNFIHGWLHCASRARPARVKPTKAAVAVHTACHTQHHEELFLMCQALCRMEDWWKNITLSLKSLQISWGLKRNTQITDL